MKTEITYGKLDRDFEIESGLWLDLDARNCGGKLETREDLDQLALHSYAAGVAIPFSRIDVTGRGLNWDATGARIRVRVTFDMGDGTADTAGGWLWV